MSVAWQTQHAVDAAAIGAEAGRRLGDSVGAQSGRDAGELAGEKIAKKVRLLSLKPLSISRPVDSMSWMVCPCPIGSRPINAFGSQVGTSAGQKAGHAAALAAAQQVGPCFRCRAFCRVLCAAVRVCVLAPTSLIATDFFRVCT
jgi:hypothetical protein